MNIEQYRHELKYRIDEAQMAVIRARMEALIHYDKHAANGQYTIRSMYFDNYANRCFYENESGTDPREKYRIRIYNADSKRISLECKIKERGKTAKLSAVLSRNDFEKIMDGRPLSDFADPPDLLRKFVVLMQTQRFAPAVIVEYERAPFIYSIGNVRITLDQNIRSSTDFKNFFEVNLPTRPILAKGQHLLEVKYDELLPEFIKEALQLGNLQQTAFSKYYLCRRFSMGGQR
ncbi:MAG: polyphosphate polymerase domain-containing protein [Lachnospiraceae bacterium]|nr:polyphosphate polymerase domain-containing protein [Lachnospiraceae bacterium]